MKGLLYKQLVMLSQNKIFLLVIAVLMAVGLMPGEGNFMAVYSVLILSMLAGSNIRDDENTRWNRGCELLPIPRKTVVASYYIGNICLVLAGTLFYMILSAIVLLVTGKGPDIIPTALATIAIALFLPSITIPVTLKFGLTKAPVVQMILTFFIVGAGVMILQNGSHIVKWFSARYFLLPVILIGAAVICTFFSWMISVRIYDKKDIQ